MTTVAYANGVLAADQCLTDSGRKVRYLKKLRRLQDGSIAGMAGDVGACQDLMDWLELGALGDPCIKGEADVLVITPAREIKVYDKRGRCIEVGDAVYAMGSGGDLALGALLAGATAIRAVEIAVERDGASGFGASSLSLPRRRT